MSTNNNDNRQIILDQLKWLGIYMATGIFISLLLPFPVSLLAAFGVFIIISFYRRTRFMKKYGGLSGGVRNIFGSLSSSSIYNNAYNPLKYYCMSCGKEHKEIACPRCGSKMKKVG